MKRVLILAGLMAALGAAPAAAQMRGGNCSVGSLQLAFGTYQPFAGTPTDYTGTFTVTCSGVVCSGGCAFAVAATPGYGSYARRAMASGGSRLAYQLYTDAQRSTVWGNGTAGSAPITVVFPPFVGHASRTVSFWGRLFPRQAVSPGGYGDAIVVTLAY